MAEYTDHLLCETFPYVTPAEVIACCPAAADLAEDDDGLLDAIDDASLVVFYLTGKQFYGTCTATTRPGCLSGPCTCGCNPNQVELGFWPVTSLISVRYDGTLYTGSDLTDTFHVNDYHYLARNDGEPFLTGNQWAVAGGEYDDADHGHVFEVVLEHGLTVPRLIKRATKALACQWALACAGASECKLPERVTSVARRGVTMDVASVSDVLRDGKTGIYEVDLAIQVFNPSKLQSPSFIWSAQGNRSGRRVGS